MGVSSIHNHALCPRQDGGGHPDGPWFKDTKLEYHNDGNRKLVALDAPEDPQLRYQTCDPSSSFLSNVQNAHPPPDEPMN